MARITDLIKAAQDNQRPCWSFEFFPPVTEQGMSNLLTRMERMASLSPAWMAVTWGAGGSTQHRSLMLAEGAQSRANVDACLHLTCTNMERDKLDQSLLQAKEAGITNILALRGDPPRGDEYWVTADERFQHAVDLVQYIREQHSQYFCIGVAGYPEGLAGDGDADVDQEIQYLKAKVDAGADFVVTQLFYDTHVFLQWLKKCRAAGISVPIVPGIMPIHSYQSFKRMVKLTRTRVPEDILQHLEPIQTDDQAVKEYGVELSIKMIRELLAANIFSYHFCTLNLERSVRNILDSLEWTNLEPVRANGPVPKVIEPTAQNWSKGQDSSSSWDEHPNGRFGDVRSPAYGELDGWGVSLKLTPAEAVEQWSYPTTTADISQIFARYLDGNVTTSLPWSDMPLMEETTVIVPQLRRLNIEKGWWTVGSQPAVDGVPSADKTYGFGPKGGYVWQKAFVEFWATEAEVDMIAKKAAAREEANGNTREVTWYAAGALPTQWRTNMQKGDANAVTWGSFPGKDIVTTTLIEEVSFRTWKEEAFSIWVEWEHLYPAASPSRKLLRDLHSSRWLVSVVHHDFRRPEALWQFLLED